MLVDMKRLNIFVDETGEFGFTKRASKLYGISFTFHDQDDDITSELEKLNDRLNRIGYSDMIHMADLIMHRGDYAKFDINKRKSIFNAIYQFSRKIPVKYYTIIVDKKYTDNGVVLRKHISLEINKMLKENEKYFNKFDKIVMYYDNGQEELGIVLNSLFSRFNGFEHRIDFDHKEKRLFQVSDMLTVIDKLDYKRKNNIRFTKAERYFFNGKDFRHIINLLKNKRI